MNLGRSAMRALFLGTSTLALGCGAVPSEPGGGGGGAALTGSAASTTNASPSPSVEPTLPDVTGVDRDGDRVDDRLDSELATARDELAAARTSAARALAELHLTERVRVEAIFARAPTASEVQAFEAEGGQVTYVFRAVSHGFLGTLPRDAAPRTAARLGPALLLLAGDAPLALHLDRATRVGRVRPVWAAGFAGAATGFSGSPTTTIGVMDTGVDDSHPDLAGRAVFFHDYTADAHATPADFVGHGSHVAGIALGTGAAFGLGPAKLSYTDSNTLAAVPSQNILPMPVHLPAAAITFTSKATWLGGGSTVLGLIQAPDGTDAWQPLLGAFGPSPQTVVYSGTPAAGSHWSAALVQTPALSVGSYAIANTISSYPAVGDGFNAFRGVAPSCQWAGAKVFADSGTGDLSATTAALDDLVAQRVALKLEVLNMSFGLTPGGTVNPALRAKIDSAVHAGVLVVVSTGNDGPNGGMSDPSRAALALTVGSSNPIDQLTDYTTAGFAAPDATEDDKPDVLAPGGSAHYGHVLSVDSNDTDGAGPTFADQVPNDYANLQGSSMAAPFVSGAAALVIQALENAGGTWDFASPATALQVKMLLCASATETNMGREGGVNGPVLGRAASPKDHAEGFGLINPDAAIEAASLTYAGGTLSGSTTGSPMDRRAWGRKLQLASAVPWKLTLTTDASADYDLYLYASAPNGKGDPIILASSTNAGAGVAESLSFTPAADGVAYGFVKRVSGSGAFTIAGGPVVTCAVDGSPCDDGNACTTGDTCKAGACVAGPPVTCAPLDSCHSAGTCDPASGICSTPVLADGTACDDGNACTQADSCKAGACKGNSAVTCVASDPCHSAGTCNPATGQCSNPSLADGTACNDGNACTATDVCQAGACVAGTPVSCAPIDMCHGAGTCNQVTGICAYPALQDGTACSDGNACTQGDSCKNGACVGTASDCGAPDACHAAGSCDPATGACSHPVLSDGTACNDGNACTQGDACLAGACVAVAVTCPAPDDCHVALGCDPATGICVANPKADGSPCPGGQCAAGSCIPGGAGGAGGGLPDAGTGGGAPDAGAGGGLPDSGVGGGPSVPDAGTGGGLPDSGAGGGAPDAGEGGGATTSTTTSRTGRPPADGTDVLNGRACTCGVPGRPSNGAGEFAALALGLIAAVRRPRRPTSLGRERVPARPRGI